MPVCLRRYAAQHGSTSHLIDLGTHAPRRLAARRARYRRCSLPGDDEHANRLFTPALRLQVAVIIQVVDILI
jgi:hypothetical protein